MNGVTTREDEARWQIYRAPSASRVRASEVATVVKVSSSSSAL
jgi:hypothetical protein